MAVVTDQMLVEATNTYGANLTLVWGRNGEGYFEQDAGRAVLVSGPVDYYFTRHAKGFLFLNYGPSTRPYVRNGESSEIITDVRQREDGKVVCNGDYEIYLDGKPATMKAI